MDTVGRGKSITCSGLCISQSLPREDVCKENGGRIYYGEETVRSCGSRQQGLQSVASGSGTEPEFTVESQDQLEPKGKTGTSGDE